MSCTWTRVIQHKCFSNLTTKPTSTFLITASETRLFHISLKIRIDEKSLCTGGRMECLYRKGISVESLIESKGGKRQCVCRHRELPILGRVARKRQFQCAQHVLPHSWSRPSLNHPSWHPTNNWYLLACSAHSSSNSPSIGRMWSHQHKSCAPLSVPALCCRLFYICQSAPLVLLLIANDRVVHW